MEIKSLISFIFVSQAFINGVNLAIPPNQQISKCSNNGNLNSDELLKSRDIALDRLYKRYEPPQPYTGDQMTSYQGIWVRALCPPKIKMQDCWDCVKDTIPILKKNCPKHKEGVTWSILPRLYCMVRYADQFSPQGNLAGWAWARFFTAPNQPPTTATAGELEKALNNLANKLKEGVTGNTIERYGSGSISYGPGSHNLYGSMQCAPTISDEACKKCLSDATNQIHDCCSKLRKPSGSAFSINCAFWYSHDNFLPKTLPTVSNYSCN